MHATTRKAHNMRRGLASTLMALSPWPAACTDDAVVGVGVTDTSTSAPDIATVMPDTPDVDAGPAAPTDSTVPDVQDADAADTWVGPDLPALVDATDAFDTMAIADSADTSSPDTTPDAATDTPKDIALPDPTTCGDGVCAGEETVPNCPADCGFLTNRYAGPCAKPGSWDGCPEGYVCVARSAKGGGNVCTADFEGWAPIGDSHPASDFDEFADYDVDKKTGLFWAKAVMGPMTWEVALTACTTQTYGGFEDWRIPTQAELLTLVDYSVHSPASSMPGAEWPEDPRMYAGVPGLTLDTAAATQMEVGLPYSEYKVSISSIRCVRANSSDAKLGIGTRLQPNATGVIFTDRISGRVWQLQTKNGAEWSVAEASCQENSGSLPGAGWRVPTIGELRQLKQRVATSALPALYALPFWGGWTSTPHWYQELEVPSGVWLPWDLSKLKWAMNCAPNPAFSSNWSQGKVGKTILPVQCVR